MARRKVEPGKRSRLICCCAKRTKWRGDEAVLIDRFDVRSHLDYLEEYKPSDNDELK